MRPLVLFLACHSVAAASSPCGKGYYRNSVGACVQFAGKCLSGTLAAPEDRTKHNHCGSCIDDKVVVGNKCVQSTPSSRAEADEERTGRGHTRANLAAFKDNTPIGEIGVPANGTTLTPGSTLDAASGGQDVGFGANATTARVDGTASVTVALTTTGVALFSSGSPFAVSLPLVGMCGACRFTGHSSPFRFNEELFECSAADLNASSCAIEWDCGSSGDRETTLYYYGADGDRAPYALSDGGARQAGLEECVYRRHRIQFPAGAHQIHLSWPYDQNACDVLAQNHAVATSSVPFDQCGADESTIARLYRQENCYLEPGAC